MFLVGLNRALGWWLAVALLLFSAQAAAAAKRCVQQNNDAAQLRSDHRLLDAREAYRGCLAEPDCPNIVREECATALTDLKETIPSLLVSVLDGQRHDLAGAALLLDGHPVALNGSTLEVDPGGHELLANSGELSFRLQVVAIERDLNRRVEIVLQPAPSKTEVAAQAGPAREAARAPIGPALLRPRSKLPAYILGGVAGVGAASFGYFGLRGRAGNAQLERCKPYCDAADVQSVRTKYLVADVSLGVSLLSLAGAVYWLVSTPQALQANERQAFSLAMTAGPGAAHLRVQWTE